MKKSARVGVLALLVLSAAALWGRANADTYTYDQYGRLTSVTYSSGSTATYTYDPAGNRTEVVQTH